MQILETPNGEYAVIYSSLPDYLEITNFDAAKDKVDIQTSRSVQLLLGDATTDRKLLGVYCLSSYPYDETRSIAGKLLNPPRIYAAYYDLEEDWIKSEQISWTICQLAFKSDYVKILMAVRSLRSDDQDKRATA